LQETLRHEALNLAAVMGVGVVSASILLPEKAGPTAEAA
jgi:hypothetical protein